MKARAYLIALLLGASSLLAQAGCRQVYPVDLSPLGFMAYRDAAGHPGGIVVELLQELSRRTQCQFTLTLEVPIARSSAIAAAQQDWFIGVQGSHDGKASDAFAPLIWESTDLLLHPHYPYLSLERLAADKGAVLAVVRSATYGKWADQFIARLPASRVEQTDSAEQVIRKLAAGRVSATFGNPLIYRKLLQDLQLDEQIRIVKQPQAAAMAVGLSFNTRTISQADRSLLSQQLAAIRSDGSLQRILSRYLGEAAASQLIWRAPATQPAPSAASKPAG